MESVSEIITGKSAGKFIDAVENRGSPSLLDLLNRKVEGAYEMSRVHEDSGEIKLEDTNDENTWVVFRVVDVNTALGLMENPSDHMSPMAPEDVRGNAAPENSDDPVILVEWGGNPEYNAIVEHFFQANFQDVRPPVRFYTKYVDKEFLSSP